MLLNYKFLLVISMTLFMISCSNQINMKKSYNENNFIYKAETRLIETSSNKMIMKFIGYENDEIRAKKKSLSLCKNFLNQNELLAECKIYYHEYTLFGKSSLPED